MSIQDIYSRVHKEETDDCGEDIILFSDGVVFDEFTG